ncbi:MAG: chromosome segregation protein SMC [Hyphomicrobiaceae bacterium]
MKINRLRLLGFKSFVEPTELIVERGLTGVVGPNGCGKSNLLEALRWVMGETSYKSMRASTMEDVIFSGTRHRPARNVAEVTMFIDNRDRKAPTEFNDSDTIEVTRRIERDAGSAYRINGREARARDVKILFEDAATGARSPALVRQGQISDIVNAKPEQRRRILEDAAGIAGLHTRRHEAELRLKAATANLERLQDVLGQLNSQVESLKRQARQARRYKEVSAKIRTTEALALHLAWIHAQDIVDQSEAHLGEMLAVFAKATQAESEATRREAELAEALAPLREQEAGKAAALSRLNLQSENFEAEARRVRERVEELTARREQLERDQAREDNFITEAKHLIEKLAQEITQLDQDDTRLATAEQEASVALSDGEQDLAQREEKLAQITNAAAEARAATTAAENRVRERANNVERLERQLAALAKQSDEISARAPDATKLTETNEAGQKLAAAIVTIEHAAGTAEEHATRRAAEREELRQISADADLTARALRAECETLTKLLVPTGRDDVPAIVDSVRVTPGFEAALGAALGDDLDAPVASDQPVHWRNVSPTGSDGPLPGQVEPLSTYVEAPVELARRLAQIGLVNKDSGLALQPHLMPGQRLVSKDGDLWRWDGYVAAADGTTPAAVRLAERNRLTAILKESAAATAKAQQAATIYETASQAHTKAETEAKTTRQSWREAQSELANLREALAEIERKARETENQLAAVAGARTRAEQDLKDARDALVQAEQDKRDHSASDNFEQALVQARNETQAQRSVVADKRADVSALQQNRKTGAERLKSAKAELDGWSARAKNSNEQLVSLNTRLEAAKQELAKLAELPDKIASEHQKLMSEIANAEQAQRQASDALAARENEVKTAKEALKATQNSVGEARENRARGEAKLEGARTRRQEEAHRIRETLDVAPEKCLTLAERPEDEQELPSLATVEHQLTRLKADRERLGGVNLQADDDLEVLAKDFDMLDAERADVEAAIEKLRGAISQLNREGRKRLKTAFETVNEHFGRLFTSLFGGGEASLKMLEGDDPLEGGLEILARPPGKKPATLSLLSGGEQTLTALSLIFAVFLTNPSPICVLDEVDAPLDDANVERFCSLMEKMAEETDTRFLVITHHPMTMTRMNRLFGVTMAERGVSQLVSVDLETAQSFREAS